eukprot:TRINITY_DN28069_c0_g1_i1.p1 TRINITY_DN28069_c0_g1~~TRINITY_DN28069_c0_g1_i1.p1  ORF type:complete len:2923 (-),score=610.45 TRINITY_DN28069_c0_g1_i1:59-8185(-)
MEVAEGLRCEYVLAWTDRIDSGAPVLSHRVYRRVLYPAEDEGRSEEELIYDGAGLGFTDIVPGRVGSPYVYSATTVTEVGESERSHLEVFCVAASAAPQQLRAEEAIAGDVFSWSPPKEGVPPESFSLSYAATDSTGLRETLWRGFPEATTPVTVEATTPLAVRDAREPATLSLASVGPAWASHRFRTSEVIFDWQRVPWTAPPVLGLVEAEMHEALLSWNTSKSGIAADISFELQMAAEPPSDFVTIYVGAASQRRVLHIACNVPYRFRVRALTAIHVGSFSNELVVRGCPPPDAPPDFHTCRRGHGSGGLALTWDPAAPGGVPISDYRILERVGQEETLLGTTSETVFEPPPSSDASRRSDGVRSFVVCASTAQASCGASSLLRERWVEPLAPPRPRQLELDARISSEEDGEVLLAWDPVDAGKVLEGEPTDVTVAYRVEAAAYGSEVFADVFGEPLRSPGAIVSGLEPGRAYRFRVAAIRVAGGAVPELPPGGYMWSEVLLAHSGGPRPKSLPPGPQAYALPERPEGMGEARLDELAEVDADTLALAWAPPADPRGRAVQAYELLHDGGYGGVLDYSVMLGPTVLRHRLNGLTSGAPYRVQLRARTSAGWSPLGPEATFVVCARPSEPREARVTWPMHGDPELVWLPPTWAGGSTARTAAFPVVVEKYRIWLELPGAVPVPFEEVPATETKLRLRLGDLRSNEYGFYVTATNAAHEGERSNKALIKESAMPSVMEAPRRLSAGSDWLELGWHAPAASQPTEAEAEDYELYWDRGLGGALGALAYNGTVAGANVSNLPAGRNTFRFQLRAKNRNGWGPLGPVAVLPVQLPGTPSALIIDPSLSGADGVVFLRWQPPPRLEVSGADGGFWYEVLYTNMDRGGSGTTTIWAPEARLSGLGRTDAYRFEVRACEAAACGEWSESLKIAAADRPEGPTAPVRESYVDGVLTVSWAMRRDAKTVPYVEGYVVRVAARRDGPFEVVARLDGSQPPRYSHRCNSTANATSTGHANFGGSSAVVLYFKVSALDSGDGAWAESAESQTAAHICAALPTVPGRLQVSVSRAVSGYDARLDLPAPELDGAPFGGWRVKLTHGKDDGALGQEVRWTDTAVHTHTFKALAGGQWFRAQYAAISSAGEGELSPPVYFRTVMLPPAPTSLGTLRSTDDLVEFTWQWPFLNVDDEVERWYVYVDARDGVARGWPKEPSYIVLPQHNRLTVNCSNIAGYDGPSRSRKSIHVGVAAFNAFGIGPLSPPLRCMCAQRPDRAQAPEVVEMSAQYTILRWVQPDLHGADLLAVRVRVESPSEAHGNRVDETFVFSAPLGDTFNITGTNNSQPARFSVQAISEVGEGDVSPWLDVSPKLARGPLPPRVVVPIASTDTEVTISWPLERARERGARTRGWFVYMSNDGTTWPAEDNPTRYYNSEFLTQHSQFCDTLNQKQMMWFKVAADSEVGRGPLSAAAGRRCSAPPGAPENLAWKGTSFDVLRHAGASEITWDPPLDLHGAVILGYRVYSDDGNQEDAEDRFHLAAVVLDVSRRYYRRDNTMLGREYKYRVAAVTEVGEGAAASITVKASTVPMAPTAPVVQRFPVHRRTDPIGEYGGDDPTVDIIIEWDDFDAVHGADTIMQATGGLEILSWHVFLSKDGITWSTTPLAVVVPTPALTAPFTVGFDRTYKYPCTYGEFLWFRVAAANSAGLGPMSPSLRAQCTRSPTDSPAPKRVGGSEDSIVLELSRADLHGSVLLGYTVIYQEALDTDMSEWGPERTVFVPASEHEAKYPKTRYTITGLLPGLPVRYKAKTVTESGTSYLGEWIGGIYGYKTVDKWQGISFPGPMPVLPSAPMAMNFTNASGRADIAFRWEAPESTGGAKLLGYDIFVTGFDGRWPALPTATVDAETTEYVHDCAQTDDQRLGSNGWSYERYVGFPIIQDRFCINDVTNNIGFFPDENEANCSRLCGEHEFCQMYEMRCGTDCILLEQCDMSPNSVCGSYIMEKTAWRGKVDVERVYVRVYPRTIAGRGEAKEAEFFCGLPPEPPVAEIVYFTPDSIKIRWTEPESYGSPIVAYRIYADDGRGGRFDLFAEKLPGEVRSSQVGVDIPLLYELKGLIKLRSYRIRVSALTKETESPRSAFVEAPTCRQPESKPRITYMPSSSKLYVSWQVPRFDPEACIVKEYQVLLERLFHPDYSPEFCDFAANDSNCTNGTNGTNMTNGTVEAESPAPAPRPWWGEANESGFVSPIDGGTVMTGLMPGETYRFRVRTHFIAGYYDGDWTEARMIGVPDAVAPPSHVTEESATEHITLAWVAPDMNNGRVVGYEVFRSDANGDVDLAEEPDVTCIGATSLECKSDCSYAHSSAAGDMVGCAISGLEPASMYGFRIRAINSVGAGPLSEVVEFRTGAKALVQSPSLRSASWEDCALAWNWQAAQERGAPVLHYELRIDACGDKNESASFTMSVPRNPIHVDATVNATMWPALVPERSFQAQVTAVTALGNTVSDWSSCVRCLSPPPQPRSPRRDPNKPVVAGVIVLTWEPVVNASETGGEDPRSGGCFYELFARPGHPSRPEWRSVVRIPTHDTAAGGKPAVPSGTVVTSPETPLGYLWEFKVRVENSGGYYSDSESVELGSGSLPGAPRDLSLDFDLEGRLRLSWQPPAAKLDVPLSRYEIKCGDMVEWEPVSPHILSYALPRAFPPGPVECLLRSATTAGPSPALRGAALVLR